MGDMYIDQDTLKLSPRKEHRIRAKRAIQTLVALDENPQDLVEMLFSKEEQEWLRQNLRAT